MRGDFVALPRNEAQLNTRVIIIPHLHHIGTTFFKFKWTFSAVRCRGENSPDLPGLVSCLERNSQWLLNGTYSFAFEFLRLIRRIVSALKKKYRPMLYNIVESIVADLNLSHFDQLKTDVRQLTRQDA